MVKTKLVEISVSFKHLFSDVKTYKKNTVNYMVNIYSNLDMKEIVLHKMV